PPAAINATSALIVQTQPGAVGASPSSWLTFGSGFRERVQALATFDADLDPLLTRVWLVTSAAVAGIVLLGWFALARRRRQWRDAIVNDELVLVAPVTGPAVVGLLSPRIVLPEWALTLDTASI